MAKRTSKKTSLSFESLETRASLTSMVPTSPSIQNEPSIEIASQDSHFLRYLRSLQEVHVERAIPDVEDALTADHWLESNSPT